MNIHIPITQGNGKGRFRKNEHFAWTLENTAFAADLWRRGYTSTHIAKELGISRSSFSGMASRNKDMFPPKKVSLLPKAKRGNWTKEKVAECVRLRKAGKTITATALAIGMPRASVDSLIRKRPDWFEAEKPKEVFLEAPKHPRRRSFIADRWVERIPYTTISGAVVSLPRVSIINGKEG